MKSLIVLAWMAIASPASADPPRRPHVTELPATEVVGRLQQPNATYVLSRSRPDREPVDLRTHFVDEVPRTVRRHPF